MSGAELPGGQRTQGGHRGKVGGGGGYQPNTSAVVVETVSARAGARGRMEEPQGVSRSAVELVFVSSMAPGSGTLLTAGGLLLLLLLAGEWPGGVHRSLYIY